MWMLLFVRVAFGGVLPDLESTPWPDVANPVTGDFGLVVGVETYSQLPAVPFAKRDAELMYQTLTKVRGIDPSNVELMSQDMKASRGTLLKAAERIGKEAGSGDTVWFYFGGHGAADNQGKRILMGWDTTFDEFHQKGVRIDELVEMMSSGGATVISIIDACYSGVGRTGEGITGGKRFAVPVTALAPIAPQIYSWYAVEADQTSGPLQAAGHGAFTYLVAAALRGWADTNRDKKVTLAEADEYVRKTLKTLQIRDQVPVLVVETNANAVALTRGDFGKPPILDPTMLEGDFSERQGTGVGSGLSAQLAQLRKDIQGTGDASERQFKMSKLVRTEAKVQWQTTMEMASTGRPEGKEALSTFVETYEGTRIEVDGRSYVVSIPEVDLARKLLENYVVAIEVDGINPRQRTVAMRRDLDYARAEMKAKPALIVPGVGVYGIVVGSTSAEDAKKRFLTGRCLARGTQLKERSCDKVSGKTWEKANFAGGPMMVGDAMNKVTIGLTNAVVSTLQVDGAVGNVDGLRAGGSTLSEVIQIYGEPSKVVELGSNELYEWHSLGFGVTVRDQVVTRMKVFVSR